MAKNNKKTVLTVEVFNSENLATNDICFAVSWIIHKYNITLFSEKFLSVLSNNYNEYILDIILLIPDQCVEMKKQLYYLKKNNRREIRKIFEICKNDREFCKFIIKDQEYHQVAADHGLSA